MRRHRIMFMCGDKVYYSYWYKNTDEVYLYVRSKTLKFRPKLLGIFKLKIYEKERIGTS